MMTMSPTSPMRMSRRLALEPGQPAPSSPSDLFGMFPDSDSLRLYWLLAAVNWAVAAVLVLVAGSSLGAESYGANDVAQTTPSENDLPNLESD